MVWNFIFSGQWTIIYVKLYNLGLFSLAGPVTGDRNFLSGGRLYEFREQ